MHFKCFFTNKHIFNTLMRQNIYQVYKILTFVTPNNPSTFKLWIGEETLSLASTGKPEYNYFFMTVAGHIDFYRVKMAISLH